MFAVYNIKQNTAKFYISHEGNGKIGPNDVYYFLLDYINKKISETVKTLHLFNDNCARQNENQALTKMLLALVEMKKFDKII